MGKRPPKIIRIQHFNIPFLFFACTLTSCFVSTKRLFFKNEIPLVSQNSDFNKDSLKFSFTLERKLGNFVMPFFIFNFDKKKYRLEYQLLGKGISGREYDVQYKYLTIKNDSVVVARSKDPDLFKDRVQRPFPNDAVTPLYASQNLLKLVEPDKLKLHLEMKIELKNKLGMTDSFEIRMPLKQVYVRNIKLFHPPK